MRKPRISIRSLMIMVALTAVLLASPGPLRQCYRRLSHYRAEAARYEKFEEKELSLAESEFRASRDRKAILASLREKSEFAEKSPQDLEALVDRDAEYHKQRGEMSLAASKDWGEKRRYSEKALFTAFDPFGPSVP